MPTDLVVGIDLGGTKILGCLIDPAHPSEILAERKVATPTGTDAVVDAIDRVVVELAGEEVTAVGLGVAGLVDGAGILRFAPNLPGLVDVDLPARLEHCTGRTVVVDNDANVATWAEHRIGVANGVENLVMVTLGTGIGGGVVVDGILEHGASGFASEMGHMVVDPVGPECPCGRRGCWERFASGTGLGLLGRQAVATGHGDAILALADGGVVTGEHVTRAAAQADRDALDVMAQFGWWVALGLANLANIFDPEMLVIGGGLAAAGDLLVDPVRRAFEGLAVGHLHRREIPIELARIGPRAGAIGAALVAAEARQGGDTANG